jgi:hypothetical protein
MEIAPATGDEIDVPVDISLDRNEQPFPFRPRDVEPLDAIRDQLWPNEDGRKLR